MESTASFERTASRAIHKPAEGGVLMIDETTRKKIILLIWRGFGFIQIGRELRTLDTLPSVEDEIRHAAIEIRTEIEDLVKTLPETIKQAMQKRFTPKQIFDGIIATTDLVPTWNLDN